MLTTKKQVRSAFWEAHQQFKAERRSKKTQNDYRTDIRVSFTDYVDHLHNNGGQCFTKNKTYQVEKDVKTTAGLMEAQTKNDLGQPHIIGSWWRDFSIVEN